MTLIPCAIITMRAGNTAAMDMEEAAVTDDCRTYTKLPAGSLKQAVQAVFSWKALPYRKNDNDNYYCLCDLVTVFSFCSWYD